MQSIWMVAAALLFSVMGVCVKLASVRYDTWEIVAYRGLVGTLVIGSLAATQARRRGTSVIGALATQRLAMHLRRGVSGTISLTLWFAAIAGLPLATAMTINSSSPLFIGAWVAWCAWRAGERIERSMSVALLSGFCGVVLLLQPTLARDQAGYALVGIVSTMFTAVAYLSVKALGRAGEPDTRIVFWFSVMNSVTGLCGAAVFGFHALDLHGIALLGGVGLAGALAQLAVTRAFASGGTLLTANLGYIGIVFSTAWGYLVFGDTLHATNAVGMVVIVASGTAATLLTARALRQAAVAADIDAADSAVAINPSVERPANASAR